METKLKRGDILVHPNYDNTLGDIFILDKLQDNKYYKWICKYNIENGEFSISDGSTHLGVVGEYDNTRKASETEEILLLNILDKYNYYWDEKKHKLIYENDGVIGKPQIGEYDKVNGLLNIKYLSPFQKSVIESLVRSWCI